MPQPATVAQREAASRDLWVRNQIAFLQGQSHPIASGIARPGTTEEVAEVMRLASAEGRKVVPLGAGSGVCGGISAGGDDLVLDLKRLNCIDVTPAAGIATFGAGVMGRHAEEACNRLGYTIGHFPSSIACSTVGGWVAARGAGQLSSRYGKIEDICVGATAVLADGSIRNAWRSTQELAEWTGNEGTLAVLTEVVFRIRPLREGWTFAAFMAANLGDALAAAKQMVRQRPVPSLLRVYDPIDSRIALSHSQGRLPRQLPYLLAAPRLVRAGGDALLRRCLVVVGWEGNSAPWQEASKASTAIALALGLRELGPAPGEKWLARRHDVSFKQIAVLRSRHFADTFEVGCPWTRVEPVYRAVRKAISPEAVSMAHFSHAYTDGSAIYFSMVGKIDAYERTWERALAAASSTGATISHHHGVGRLKAAWMVRELGGTHSVLVAAKQEYDSEGVLNPGCLGLPCEARDAKPHAGFPGIDRANGHWCGSLDERLGDIEAKLRPMGWSLGVAESAKQTMRAFIGNDLCGVESTVFGSAQDRVLAIEGELDGGGAFGTRLAPRSATGPDLRRRILAGNHAIDFITVRLRRRPDQWLHLHGTFSEPLAMSQAILAGGHEPWAAMIHGGRVDLWFAYATPASKLLADAVPWRGERDHDAPDELTASALATGRWRPWRSLHVGLITGLGGAGGWQVEEAP